MRECLDYLQNVLHSSVAIDLIPSVRFIQGVGIELKQLYTKHEPKTCRNFSELSHRVYFNNILFHRVIKNFMVQGGDPTTLVGTRIGCRYDNPASYRRLWD